MTYKTPLRLTILHFEQRFLIDADTFISFLLLIKTQKEFHSPDSRSFHYTVITFSRPVFSQECAIIHSGCAQLKGLSTQAVHSG